MRIRLKESIEERECKIKELNMQNKTETEIEKINTEGQPANQTIN